jgi:hypothetical protein
MSRAVNGEFYFKQPADKQCFVENMWLIAEFCGVQILTFVILDNHFHVETFIPLAGPIADDELLRRYELLHPATNKRNRTRLAAIKSLLTEHGPAAVEWRRNQTRQMGNLSQFMKLLKQRFSIQYNRAHNRFGTLWAERFKSVLMDGEERDYASECTGVYIDLNAVRAGLTRDPKDYRFCGYGAAVGGDQRARKGIMFLTGRSTWEEAQASYRLMLFTAGSAPSKKGGSISPEELRRAVEENGKLPLSAALLCRTRYLTNTLALGSAEFVSRHLADYRRRTGARMLAGPRRLPPYTDWGGLCALRSPKLVN